MANRTRMIMSILGDANGTTVSTAKIAAEMSKRLRRHVTEENIEVIVVRARKEIHESAIVTEVGVGYAEGLFRLFTRRGNRKEK